MDVCLTWIILGLITLGLLFYLMPMYIIWMTGLDNVFDGLAKEGAEEEAEEGFSIDRYIKIANTKDFIETSRTDSGELAYLDREGAIYALGESGDKRAVDPLVKILNDKNKDIRSCAAEALDKLGWEPEND